MRTFILVVVLAVPLCLATTGCGVLGDALAALDSEDDDPHDPMILMSHAEDVPPSAIISGDSSF